MLVLITYDVNTQTAAGRKRLRNLRGFDASDVVSLFVRL